MSRKTITEEEEHEHDRLLRWYIKRAVRLESRGLGDSRLDFWGKVYPHLTLDNIDWAMSSMPEFYLPIFRKSALAIPDDLTEEGLEPKRGGGEYEVRVALALKQWFLNHPEAGRESDKTDSV